MGIACMIVGYVLGSIDTDKKWIDKYPVQTPGCPAPDEDESIVERLRKGKI